MSDGSREQIIGRLISRDGSYWLYNKNFIDDGIDSVLEKKPEEKIWRVVRENYVPEMEYPCYRIKKKDLIKVGRVRFKIRDLMSPAYRRLLEIDDYNEQRHA